MHLIHKLVHVYIYNFIYKGFSWIFKIINIDQTNLTLFYHDNGCTNWYHYLRNIIFQHEKSHIYIYNSKNNYIKNKVHSVDMTKSQTNKII